MLKASLQILVREDEDSYGMTNVVFNGFFGRGIRSKKVIN